MKCQLEAFSRWMREAVERGMFEAQWREVGENLEEIPLEPDFEKLLQLERIGMLASFTARTDEGELAGYALIVCAPHIFYKSHAFAFSQVIYIAPEHRGRGSDLIVVIERELRGRGASKVFFMTKDSTDFGRIFEALGYARSETSWGKLL